MRIWAEERAMESDNFARGALGLSAIILIGSSPILLRRQCSLIYCHWRCCGSRGGH